MNESKSLQISAKTSKYLFPLLYDNIILEKLLQKLNLLILRGNEEDYFDLESFEKKWKPKNMKVILAKVYNNLDELGWKYKTSFGGTGLFVYSSENPPKTCWNDGL